MPPPLKDVSLRALDLGLLQAGAAMKGEFEKRLKSVIDEVQASPHADHPVHRRGAHADRRRRRRGHGDAANLLKPALARGELRTIAATTWAEYKKYFEKDAALTRRFQTVKVDEPERRAWRCACCAASRRCWRAPQGRASCDEALASAVALSHRYLPARQLPDKAVSVLDTACARVAISQAAIPAELEDCRRRIGRARGGARATASARRGSATAPTVAGRARATAAEQEQARAAELEARWEEEKELWSSRSGAARGDRRHATARPARAAAVAELSRAASWS